MEFEKSDDSEMLLKEADEFSREEEKKEYLEDVHYNVMKNRRRRIGNVRFIGELYKLKMLSESIMHGCMFKLLKRAEEQPELQEHQLEYLCVLLTSIGGTINHAKAKSHMDKYFLRIHTLVENGQLSAKVIVALNDVMNLRNNGWIPTDEN